MSAPQPPSVAASSGKKRKAPSVSSSTTAASVSVPSNNNKGVDTLLTIRGRPLKPGQSVSFQLFKGPSVQHSGDPVDSNAPWSRFPLIAKFGESVVRPSFVKEPWKSARLFEQEVPKPVDDSDEEGAEGTGGGANAGGGVKKRRWRFGNDQPPRQWILQENVDFLQTMVDRKENPTAAADGAGDDKKQQQLSSRYEGMPEHNASQFALIRLHPNTKSPKDATLQLCLLPAPADQNSIMTFAQPAARKTYSLTEAEHVISDQRMGLVKSLHHMQSSGPGAAGNDGDKQGEDGGDTGEAAAAPPPRPNILALRKKAAASSKGRLLSKLKSKSKQLATDKEEEDGDDVMGDVAFRTRKGGGGGAARKELLAGGGGAGGVTVSDEGVLGGSNDAMFGGRQRFAQLAEDEGAAAAANNNEKGDDGGGADQADDALAGGAGGASGQDNERGADGAAMDDDFYQRDVKAEYDELDFDANEQFDDDDVDMDETAVVVDTSGFDGDDNIEEDNDEEEAEEEAETVTGAQGLASLAGFKALLAKARGEEVDAAAALQQANEAAAAAAARNPNQKKRLDHMSKIMAAAEQSRLAAERKNRTAGESGGGAAAAGATADEQDEPVAAAPTAAAAPAASSSSETPLVDEHGLRIITLDSVRREIWLNHGSMPMKRLTKIFKIRSKAPERRAKFLEMVRELCTMKSDPLNGNVLVLKQHYSKG